MSKGIYRQCDECGLTEHSSQEEVGYAKFQRWLEAKIERAPGRSGWRGGDFCSYRCLALYAMRADGVRTLERPAA